MRISHFMLFITGELGSKARNQLACRQTRTIIYWNASCVGSEHNFDAEALSPLTLEPLYFDVFLYCIEIFANYSKPS